MQLTELSKMVVAASALFTLLNAFIALGGMDEERPTALSLVWFGSSFGCIGLSLHACGAGNGAACGTFLTLAFDCALLGEHRWRTAHGLPGFRNRP